MSFSKHWRALVTAFAAGSLLSLGIPGALAAPADLAIESTTGATAPVEDADAGYLWAHFGVDGGPGDGHEKIFFGYSKDGLHWEKLNNGQPILEVSNPAGDGGVRDPHILRSPDGSKYWILGTDLHAEGDRPGDPAGISTPPVRT